MEDYELFFTFKLSHDFNRFNMNRYLNVEGSLLGNVEFRADVIELDVSWIDLDFS